MSFVVAVKRVVDENVRKLVVMMMKRMVRRVVKKSDNNDAKNARKPNENAKRRVIHTYQRNAMG
jgi:hypothetical protein